jgi:hypothetical protein
MIMWKELDILIIQQVEILLISVETKMYAGLLVRIFELRVVHS